MAYPDDDYPSPLVIDIGRRPAEGEGVERVGPTGGGPETLDRSTSDPRLAPAPGGDIVEPPPRGALQRILDYGARSPGAGALSGFGSMIGGIGDLYNMATRRTGEAFDYLGVPKTFDLPESLRPGNAFRTYGQGLETQAQNIDVPPEYQNYWTRGLNATGQLIPQAMAMMTGPVGATTLLGAQGAHSMAPLIEKSGMAGTWQGDAAMLAGAAATAASERLGLEAMWHGMPLPIKNKVIQGLASIAAGGGIEAVEEAAENVMHTLVANNTLGLNESYWPDINNLLSAAFAGKAGRAGSMAKQSTQPGGALNRYFNPPNAEAPPPVNLGDFIGDMARTAGVPTTQQAFTPTPEQERLLAVSDDDAKSLSPEDKKARGMALRARAQANRPVAQPKVVQEQQPLEAMGPWQPPTPDSLGFWSQGVEQAIRAPFMSAPVAQWYSYLTSHEKGPYAKRGNKVTPYEMERAGFDAQATDNPKVELTKDQVVEMFQKAHPDMQEQRRYREATHKVSPYDLPVSPRIDPYTGVAMRDPSTGHVIYDVKHPDTGEVIDSSPSEETLIDNLYAGKYEPQGIALSTEHGNFNPPGMGTYHEFVGHARAPSPTHYAVTYTNPFTQEEEHVGNYPTEAEAQAAAQPRTYERPGEPGRTRMETGYPTAMLGDQPLNYQAWNHPMHFHVAPRPPDPLYHQRQLSFVTPSGKRATYATEVQNDYSQLIREATNYYEGAGLEELEKNKGRPPTEDEKQAFWDDLLAGTYSRIPAGRIKRPDDPARAKELAPHPYIDKPAVNQDAALKRMIYRAVQDGYDALAISPAQEQAKRWGSMGNVYTDLEYDPNTGRAVLTNPLGERHEVDAPLKQSAQQDTMIREFGSELAADIRQRVKDSAPPPVNYKIVERTDEERQPTQTYTVQRNPEQGEPPPYTIERYMGISARTGTEVPRYRVLGPDGDVQRGSFVTRQSAEDELNYLTRYQGGVRWNVVDQDGRISSDENNESDAQERARLMTEGSRPERFAVHDEDGNVVNEDDSEDRARRWINRQNSRINYPRLQMSNMGSKEGPKGARTEHGQYAVTGSGFHQSYDKVLLDKIDRILKNSFGSSSKVERFSPDAPIEQKNTSYGRNPNNTWEMLRQNNMSLDQAVALKNNDPAEFNRLMREAGKFHHGHLIDLTDPELKKKILGGSSAYARGGRVKGPLRQYASRYADGGKVNFNSLDAPLGVGSMDVVPGNDDSQGMISDLPGDAQLDQFVKQREQPLAAPSQILAPPPGGGQKQGGGGGGGEMMQMASMAMKFLPMFLADGGSPKAYRDDSGNFTYQGNVVQPRDVYTGEGGIPMPWARNDVLGETGGNEPESLYARMQFRGGPQSDRINAGRLLGGGREEMPFRSLWGLADGGYVPGYADGGYIEPEDRRGRLPPPGIDDEMLNYGAMFYRDGGPVRGYSMGGGDIFDKGQWDRQTGGGSSAPTSSPDKGTFGNIAGTVGALLGNLIPIPVLGPMIGGFIGDLAGAAVEGKTGELGDMAARRFTMGMVDPDAIDSNQGDFGKSLMGKLGGLPGLGGGLKNLFGGIGGGGFDNLAGGAPTDVGSWGGEGLGSGFTFADGGQVQYFDEGGRPVNDNRVPLRVIEQAAPLPIDQSPQMQMLINKYKYLLDLQNKDKKAAGGYVPGFADGGLTDSGMGFGGQGVLANLAASSGLSQAGQMGSFGGGYGGGNMPIRGPLGIQGAF